MEDDRKYEDYLDAYYGDNYKWEKNDIAKLYKYENPNWDWDKCIEKAELIYKELNKLNTQMWKNNKIYFRYNKPFSFFENRDDEFEEIFFDRNSN